MHQIVQTAFDVQGNRGENRVTAAGDQKVANSLACDVEGREAQGVSRYSPSSLEGSARGLALDSGAPDDRADALDVT